MSKKEKLITRLLSQPKDFSFDEVKSLLGLCGYAVTNAGRTSGSRICFIRGQKIFRMHKPHPRNTLLAYQINDLIDELKQEGLI